MSLWEIREFEWEYFFLNNFYETPVEYEGMTYWSAEAAFQAAKCFDPSARKSFQTMTPEQAKIHGRQVFLRSDWEDVKVQVMYDVLKNKFSSETIRNKLMSTGSAILIEGNNVNDRFRGVDLETGEGENHVGKILMNLREKLLNAI